VLEGVLRPHGVEKVAGVQHRVPEILEHAAVDFVRPALRHDVHHRAGAAAIFGIEIGKHAEFGDGLERKYRGRYRKDPALIDYRQVAVAVVHVRAVEQEIVGSAAVAVARELAVGARGIRGAAGVTGGAGGHDQGFVEVPAVDGQVHQILVHEGAAQVVVGRLDGGDGFFGDFHALGDITGLQGE